MAACEPSDFQDVINRGRATRTLTMGLKEVVRAMASSNSELVILATDVNNNEYTSLVEGMAKESKTPLIKVDSKELLGQWCGLAKLDEEGEVTKARACGAVSLRSLPSTPAGEKIKTFIQANNA